ncbi:MAG: glycosyltransferase family 4 protein [Chitinispirillaceae bacterium]
MLNLQFLITSGLFLLALAVAYSIIKIVLRTKLATFFVDTPDARKVHTSPIPRLGGVAIIISVMAVLFPWFLLSRFDFLPPIHKGFFLSIFTSVLTLGVFGFLDDSKFHTMRVRHKLYAVIALALSTVYLFNIHPGAISVFDLFTIPLWLSKVIAVLWIIGLINAFNLVDGLDGLAGTISLVSLTGICSIAFFTGNSEAAILSMIVAGATVGFLFHNAPPAKIFMGDTGSLFLGFAISLLGIHVARWVPQGKVPLILPLLVGIPILEVFVSIVRRYFKANDLGHTFKKILKFIVTADSSHIHHRFLFRGFSHLETCALVGILSATLVTGAVCILFAPPKLVFVVPLYLIIPIAVSLYRLGFGGRFKKALKLSRSQFNGYHKPELIGVIEPDGKLFHYLSRKQNNGYVFVPLANEKDLPVIASQLRATIVRSSSGLPEIAARVSKELSTMYHFSTLLHDSTPRETIKIVPNLKSPVEDPAAVEKILQGFESEYPKENGRSGNKQVINKDYAE